MPNPSQNLHVKAKIRETSTVTVLANLINRLKSHHIIPVGQLTTVEAHQTWLCEKCSKQFTGVAYNGRTPRCYSCFPHSGSRPQQAIANFINELLGPNQMMQNDRTILANQSGCRRSKEIDILVPSYQFGIEYCGLRWHTEITGGKGRQYQYSKMDLCRQQGIQLLTIYADEWDAKQQLIESMIRIRLGMGTKLYARRLSLAEVPYQQGKLFF